MRAPRLFVRGNVGQVLQRSVRGNGTHAGHRLCVRTRQMQRQNIRIRNAFRNGRTKRWSEARTRLARSQRTDPR
jgi:hypothetical protein